MLPFILKIIAFLLIAYQLWRYLFSSAWSWLAPGNYPASYQFGYVMGKNINLIVGLLLLFIAAAIGRTAKRRHA